VIFPSVTLRYRLTVDVDVDGVTHSGSGAVEFTYQPLPDSFQFFGGGAHFIGEMRGYAITVDLAQYGPLFVVNYRPLGSTRDANSAITQVFLRCHLLHTINLLTGVGRRRWALLVNSRRRADGSTCHWKNYRYRAIQGHQRQQQLV
jgi:hypothetical protein